MHIYAPVYTRAHMHTGIDTMELAHIPTNLHPKYPNAPMNRLDIWYSLIGIKVVNHQPIATTRYGLAG